VGEEGGLTGIMGGIRPLGEVILGAKGLIPSCRRAYTPNRNCNFDVKYVGMRTGEYQKSLGVSRAVVGRWMVSRGS